MRGRREALGGVAILLWLAVTILSACNDGTDVIFKQPGFSCDQPGNLVDNCGFDTDLSGFRLYIGVGGATAVHVPDDGGLQSGCMEMPSLDSSGFHFAIAEQCIVPVYGESYRITASVRVTEGMPDGCGVIVSASNATCTQGGSNALTAELPRTDAWSTSAPISLDWLSSWDAVNFRVQCSGNTPFTVRLDDFIFADARSTPRLR